MPVGAWELEYGCTTVADPNRVATYVAHAQSGAYEVDGVNLLSPYRLAVSTIRVNCGCDALNWTADTPGTAPTPIVPYTYPADPANLAPWYTDTYPESAHFWGWMVEKIEEVATPSWSRAVNDRISGFGGGAFGALRKKGRAMRVTLMGFGGYETAMDYGFRWLTDILGYENSPCESCDLTIRTGCPPVEDEYTYDQWDTGRWTFKQAVLVDGPRYEESPNPAATCNVRRVSFTIVAAVPFAHKCPVPTATQGATWIEQLWSPGDPGCPPMDWVCNNGSYAHCQDIIVEDVIGEEALIFEIQAGHNGLSNVTISVTPNPWGAECPLDGITPCDTVTIAYIPPDYLLRYDSTTESITVTPPGGVTIDATYLLDTTTGTAPPFPALRYGRYCVCVTSDRCSWNGDPNSTVSIWTVHREMAV